MSPPPIKFSLSLYFFFQTRKSLILLCLGKIANIIDERIPFLAITSGWAQVNSVSLRNFTGL